jgi:acyl carrier protein
VDQQVKIRGFRIEIGEIETQLRDHVRDCAVAPIEDGSGGKHLIAFVVPREGREIDRSRLRRALGQKLPEYMIPSDFILLDELPLTPNGKVDRKALRLMKRSSHDLSAVFVPPSAPTEATVAAAYTDVLGVSQVGVHDDFFELGGHSLTATRVMARIESAFQVKLALRHIFEAPTVRELAAIIDQERELQAGAALGAIRPRRRGAKNLDQLFADIAGLSSHETERLLRERRLKTKDNG